MRACGAQSPTEPSIITHIGAARRRHLKMGCIVATCRCGTGNNLVSGVTTRKPARVCHAWLLSIRRWFCCALTGPTQGWTVAKAPTTAGTRCSLRSVHICSNTPIAGEHHVHWPAADVRVRIRMRLQCILSEEAIHLIQAGPDRIVRNRKNLIMRNPGTISLLWHW
jgi:hypothetical protein